MQLFVTRMLRYGDRDGHSYIVGVYDNEVQAKYAGTCEESWRGGKYSYVVEYFELNSKVPQKIWEYHYGLHSED